MTEKYRAHAIWVYRLHLVEGAFFCFGFVAGLKPSNHSCWNWNNYLQNGWEQKYANNLLNKAFGMVSVETYATMIRSGLLIVWSIFRTPSALSKIAPSLARRVNQPACDMTWAKASISAHTHWKYILALQACARPERPASCRNCCWDARARTSWGRLVWSSTTLVLQTPELKTMKQSPNVKPASAIAVTMTMRVSRLWTKSSRSGDWTPVYSSTDGRFCRIQIHLRPKHWDEKPWAKGDTRCGWASWSKEPVDASIGVGRSSLVWHTNVSCHIVFSQAVSCHLSERLDASIWEQLMHVMHLCDEDCNTDCTQLACTNNH